MDTPLTHQACIELVRTLRARYQASRSRTKKQILKEFVAVTGYNKKYALHLLNAPEVSTPAGPRRRRRTPLYDEAAKKALVEVWEVLDRSCGKILKAAMPTTLDALERHQRLKLDDAVRGQLLVMSAATIDRALRSVRAVGKSKKRRRGVPEIRRLIPVRTFGDWNDPPPGSMEMDLVAHCGEANRGSYINSLVLTDIGSGWTECAALLVRESGLLVQTLDGIRAGLPFVLCALDVDNGSEFINETLIEYCLAHHIELTRSRPYRKNDQAWIEQKNGDVVRRQAGYERFEGIAAFQALSRLYGTVRLYQNFFQPSFKLAEKHRWGSKVTKRYLPPATPCDRLLQAESVPESTKVKLRELALSLDPVKLMQEIHASRARLAVIAQGGEPKTQLPKAPNLPAFLASVSPACQGGEVRPTPAVQNPARDPHQTAGVMPASSAASSMPMPTQAKVVPLRAAKSIPADRPLWHGLDPEIKRQSTLKQQEFARRRIRRQHAFTLVWPLVCRRLEARPNFSAAELFDELCTQYPGRFHRGQLAAFGRRVIQWRKDARARGMQIGPRTYRDVKDRGRRRPDPFQAHWAEMLRCLQADPDQTALELLATFMAQYPGVYQMHHLRTLQRRVKAWRRDAVERLIGSMHEFTPSVSPEAGR